MSVSTSFRDSVYTIFLIVRCNPLSFYINFTNVTFDISKYVSSVIVAVTCIKGRSRQKTLEEK